VGQVVTGFGNRTTPTSARLSRRSAGTGHPSAVRASTSTKGPPKRPLLHASVPEPGVFGDEPSDVTRGVIRP
jgi:hypothetical protein